MPRKKNKGQSLRGYFRHQLEEHPEWLDLKDNSAILEQWKIDNPGQDASERIRANLASLKSKMRADNRTDPNGAVVAPKKTGPKKTNVGPAAAVKELEKLEMMIDDCVSSARALAVDRLESVIKHLRIARAQIVLMFDPLMS